MEAKIRDYVKRRNKALLSLDQEKMRELVLETGGEVPEDEKVFLAGMHIARLEVTSFSDEIKAQSLGWLHANGYCV